MKGQLRIIALFLGIASAASITAQQWCPPGAVWHHGYSEVMTGRFGYVLTEYTGDTVLGGLPAQILEASVHGYDMNNGIHFDAVGPTYYTTVSGSLVQQWTGFAFDTLFYFDAGPGDSWLPPGATSNLTPSIVVLDTGHASVGGTWLKFLKVDLGPLSSVPNGDTLFERLGLLNVYLDIHKAWELDDGFGALRCYSDVDITVERDSLPCDLIVGVNEPSQIDEMLVVYPNPGADQIWLLGLCANSSVEVFGTNGIKYMTHWYDPDEGIDISQLPNGLYIINALSCGGAFVKLSWAKE